MPRRSNSGSADHRRSLAPLHYAKLLPPLYAQPSDFMGYFNSNLAREVGRLAKWREKFWSRRYRAIVISGEPVAQRERLKYVLSHGAKEGLVASPLEWPGVHSLRPLLEGEPLRGLWFDRT